MDKSVKNKPQISKNQNVEKISKENILLKKQQENQNFENLKDLLTKIDDLKSSSLICNKRVRENFEKIIKILQKNNLGFFKDKCLNTLLDLVYLKIEKNLKKKIIDFFLNNFKDKIEEISEVIYGYNNLYKKKKINWDEIFEFFINLWIIDYSEKIDEEISLKFKRKNFFEKTEKFFLKENEKFAIKLLIFLKENEEFYGKFFKNIIFKEVFNFKKKKILIKFDFLKLSILIYYSSKMKDFLFLIENEKNKNLSIICKKYYIYFIENCLSEYYEIFFKNIEIFQKETFNKKIDKKKIKKKLKKNEFFCDRCLEIFQKKSNHVICFENEEIFCNFCWSIKNEKKIKENKFKSQNFFKYEIFELLFFKDIFLLTNYNNYKIKYISSKLIIKPEKNSDEKKIIQNIIKSIIENYKEEIENLKNIILFFFTKNKIKENFKLLITNILVNLITKFPSIFFYHQTFEAIYYISLKSEKKINKLLIKLFSNILNKIPYKILLENFFLKKNILEILRNYVLSGIMENEDLRTNCVEFFNFLYNKNIFNILDDNFLIKSDFDNLTVVKEEILSLLDIYEKKNIGIYIKKSISNIIRNLIFPDLMLKVKKNFKKNMLKKKEIYSDKDLLVFLHNLNFFINLKPIKTKKKGDIYFLYRFFEDNKVELKIIIFQLTEFLLSNYKNEKNNLIEKIIQVYKTKDIDNKKNQNEKKDILDIQIKKKKNKKRKIESENF